MIRDGQAKRFESESGEDEKANSVDVSSLIAGLQEAMSPDSSS